MNFKIILICHSERFLRHTKSYFRNNFKTILMLKNIQMIIEDFYVYIQHMCRIKILHLPYMEKRIVLIWRVEGGQTNNFFHQTEGG